MHQLEEFLEGGPAIYVQIQNVNGSSPRDVGAWMAVGATEFVGTIGGGQLEYMMIDEARKMLRNDQTHRIHAVPLGPEIGQCCGGRVELALSLIENAKVLSDQLDREISVQPDVLVFGAGHVGKALAQALQLLPCNPVLIDQRANELVGLRAIETKLAPLPEAEIRTAQSGSAIVILTHDHALDFLLAGEALARSDLSYVGMIGSKTKRAVFQNWLEDAYDGQQSAKQLVCPIGGGAVKDKRPEVIAALVAAEILQAFDHQGQLVSNKTLEGAQHAR